MNTQADWEDWGWKEKQDKDRLITKLQEKCQYLEYAARVAILTAYCYRDDKVTEEWLSSELDRLQNLVERTCDQ